MQKSSRVLEIVANLLLALCWCVFLLINLFAFRHSHNPTQAISAVETLLAILFFVIRTTPRVRPPALFDYGVAFSATFFPLLMRPAPSALPILGSTLMVIGAAVSTIGIAFLGRSFGIAPALRTIRTSGPYALIRHPMYAGILLLMFGYLLGNASVWNAVVLVATVGLMHVRMRREEALLASDEAYRHYATRVRFRLLPPLY